MAKKIRDFRTEKPEANRLICVTDAHGNCQGHLSTKIVWDGERIRTDLAHNLLVDPDNIVSWFYLDELYEKKQQKSIIMNTINEGKRVKSLNLIYTTMSENNSVVKMLRKRCGETGINLILVNPDKASLYKTADGFTLDTGAGQYSISPKNTVVMPRHPVLNSSESRNFQQTLEFYNFFTINTLAAIDACEDKYTTDRILRNNGIASPKSVVVNVDDLSDLDNKVATLGSMFPIVGKTLKGSLGIGVFICDSMMSLRSVLQMLSRIKPGQEIMLQQMIKSEYDLRIHVFNRNYGLSNKGGLEDYDIIGVMRRNKISDDFRSNFSLGATVERTELTDEQKDIAIRSARAIGCRWCGVDIITDSVTGENYVIEVNASPGLKGIESIYDDGNSPLDYIFRFMSNFISVTPEISVLGAKEYGEISMGDVQHYGSVVGFDMNRELSLVKVSASDLTYDERANKLGFHIGEQYFNVTPESVATYGGERSYLVSARVYFNNKEYKHIMFMVCVDSEDRGIVLGNNFLGHLGDKVLIDVSAEFLVTDNLKEDL